MTVLIERPKLSETGERLIAGWKAAVEVWRPPPPPPPRRIGHPDVHGLLQVDLIDNPDYQGVRQRFAAVSDAPDGVEIQVLLPFNPRPVFLVGALSRWWDLPSVTFTVIGHSTRHVRRAVRELQDEIRRFGA